MLVKTILNRVQKFKSFVYGIRHPSQSDVFTVCICMVSVDRTAGHQFIFVSLDW